jgi:hypothetical protein
MLSRLGEELTDGQREIYRRQETSWQVDTPWRATLFVGHTPSTRRHAPDKTIAADGNASR